MNSLGFKLTEYIHEVLQLKNLKIIKFPLWAHSALGGGGRGGRDFILVLMLSDSPFLFPKFPKFFKSDRGFRSYGRERERDYYGNEAFSAFSPI